MKNVLTELTKDLDWEVKQQVIRRYGAMVSQYNYLKETHNEYLIFTYRREWFDDKYTTLFALNSFFQIVLGPLSSSSRGVSEIGLGSKTPIIYGKSIRFDSERSKAINKAYSRFIALSKELGFVEWWLTSNRASDVIFSVAKWIRENESE